MLNQKKVEIFSRKFRKSLAKQFLEIALHSRDGRESIEGIFWELGVVLYYASQTTRPRDYKPASAILVVLLSWQSKATASMIPLIRNSGKATASEIP